jgi:hypothetical protein
MSDRKLRDFYMDTVELDKALDDCDLGDGHRAIVRKHPFKDALPDLTHVREVDPNLDAALAECYEILNEFNKKHSPGDNWFPELRQALTALRKARGG